MSDTSALYVAPITMLDALEKCLRICKEVFTHSPVTVNIATGLPDLRLKISENEVLGERIETKAEVVRLKEQLSRLPSVIECTSFTVSIANSQSPPQITYRSVEHGPGTITISNVPQSENLFSILEKLDSIFCFVQKGAFATDGLPRAQKQAIQYQQSTLSQLQTEVEKIAHFNLEQSKQQADFLRRAMSDMEAHLKKRDEEIEQKRKQLETQFVENEKLLTEQHNAKLNELQQREEEYKHKVEQLDIRDNMVVRRQLLGQITASIAGQPKFELSKETQEKRIWIHRICLVSIALSIVFIGCYVWIIRAATELRWFQFAPLSAGILFLVSTIAYYLKWNDQWFRDHAREETRNKKLNADILRASWLVETFFEVKDKDRMLPEQLLTRLSDGLFADTTTNGVRHPSDQMVELLKKFSSIKIGNGQVEVTKSAAKE